MHQPFSVLPRSSASQCAQRRRLAGHTLALSCLYLRDPAHEGREPYFNNENSIPPRIYASPRVTSLCDALGHIYVQKHTHTRNYTYAQARVYTYIRAHTFAAYIRDRYEPKAGVSLICLMSRYCNDFAWDLRLFIYSSAVLADRTLITEASRYTNGIKVPAPGPRASLAPLLLVVVLAATSSSRRTAARISWTS